MSLRKIINWAIYQQDADLVGIVVSDLYTYGSNGGDWLWACDVDIGDGQEVLQNVPVASNNRDLIYAEQGKSVALRRMNDGRYCVVGLAKVSRGLDRVVYLAAEDDVVRVVSRVIPDYTIRSLTLGELGTIPWLTSWGALLTGFGYIPLGQKAKFAADGSFIEFV